MHADENKEEQIKKSQTTKSKQYPKQKLNAKFYFLGYVNMSAVSFYTYSFLTA